MSPEDRIHELEKSHDQLRGALVAAGFHIRKFRHNPKNEKMLHLLRNVLRDARIVRKPNLAESAFTPQHQPSVDLDSMT